MSFELHGHQYSQAMASKYFRNMAWPCIDCKKLHTSKHEKCKMCREINCRRCEKVKVLAHKGICFRCEELVHV